MSANQLMMKQSAVQRLNLHSPHFFYQLHLLYSYSAVALPPLLASTPKSNFSQNSTLQQTKTHKHQLTNARTSVITRNETCSSDLAQMERVIITKKYFTLQACFCASSNCFAFTLLFCLQKLGCKIYPLV